MTFRGHCLLVRGHDLGGTAREEGGGGGTDVSEDKADHRYLHGCSLGYDALKAKVPSSDHSSGCEHTKLCEG